MVRPLAGFGRTVSDPLQARQRNRSGARSTGLMRWYAVSFAHPEHTTHATGGFAMPGS